MRLSSRSLAVFGAQIACVAAFVGIWQMIVELNPLYKTLIAPPVKSFLNIPTFLNYSYLGHTGLQAIEVTLALALLATGVAAGLGILLGLIIGSIRYLHSTLDPYIIAAFTVPKVVLLPVFWSLFGFGLFYELMLGIVHGVFPMLVITIYGVKAIDTTKISVASSMGASTQQIYRKVILPSAFQTIVGGLRLCFNLSFLGVIIAQLFVGQIGLGYLAGVYSTLLTPLAITNLYSLIIVTALVGMVINVLLILFERRYLRYKQH